jgi:hypothetical protein
MQNNLVHDSEINFILPEAVVPFSIYLGEEEMAEVDTSMLAGQHADIRRETAVGFGDTRYNIAERSGDIRRELADAKDVLNDSIRVEGGNTRAQSAAETSDVIKESIKGDWHNSDAIKDARYDLATRVEGAADRIVAGIEGTKDLIDNRFFDVGRDTQDIRAQVISAQQAMVTGFLGVSKDTELASLKGIIEGQKNTTYLADKIAAEGAATRGLINDLKYHDLSRGLIERNSELVEERNWGRHWYHGANQAQFGQQFAQLQSQMQNFNSQLSETRQGMVNFGTMAGVGQTSSANNVR